MGDVQATARHVKILHAFGQKRKRTRIPKQLYPKGIEREYAAVLSAQIGHARAALTPLIQHIPGLLDSARRDAGESSRAAELIAAARKALETATSPAAVQALAKKFAQRTIDFNRVQLGRQVRAAIGVDVVSSSARIQKALDHFVGENVALIKSIPSQVIDQVEGIVHRGFTGAAQTSTIADEIEERFKVGESRAKLIARDQVGKLYGGVNKVRQSDLGINGFIWRTSGDERVRPEHEELDGQRFSWDDPPSEGIPGEAIQCRCSAEPDFNELKDAVDNGDDSDT